jgi:hypothetical protein
MFYSTKLLPACIFTIGCSALAFQTTILHPFHEQLDVEFHQIRDLELQDNKLEVFEQEAMQAVSHVGTQVDELLKLKAKNLIHKTYQTQH